MANALTQPTVFTRGSAVLDYWLAHPQGLIVQPLNARVEQVSGPAPFGPAEALMVRGRNGRERWIPAGDVVAVVPSTEELILAEPERGDPIHESVARVLHAFAGRARPHVVRGMRSLAAALAWLAPRVAHHTRRSAVGTYRASRAGTLWLAPRVSAHSRRAAASAYRLSRTGAVSATRTALALRTSLEADARRLRDARPGAAGDADQARVVRRAAVTRKQ